MNINEFVKSYPLNLSLSMSETVPESEAGVESSMSSNHLTNALHLFDYKNCKIFVSVQRRGHIPLSHPPPHHGVWPHGLTPPPPPPLTFQLVCDSYSWLIHPVMARKVTSEFTLPPGLAPNSSVK